MRVIIDTDPGIDDAVAIFLALASPELDVVGLTTVFGNCAVDLATRNALAIGAGHCFVLFLRDGFPVNVLNPIKAVPEVCTIYCATANPVEVLVGVTPLGRGVVGIVDGEPPLGVETEDDVAARHDLLRAIGYKL